MAKSLERQKLWAARGMGGKEPPAAMNHLPLRAIGRYEQSAATKPLRLLPGSGKSQLRLGELCG
jgi:hypothetical protein